MSNLDVTKKQYSKLKTMSKITKFRQRFATFKLQLISHNIRKRVRDASIYTSKKYRSSFYS